MCTQANRDKPKHLPLLNVSASLWWLITFASRPPVKCRQFVRVITIMTFLQNVSYDAHITGWWPDISAGGGDTGFVIDENAAKPMTAVQDCASMFVSLSGWLFLTRSRDVSTCVSVTLWGIFVKVTLVWYPAGLDLLFWWEVSPGTFS